MHELYIYIEVKETSFAASGEERTRSLTSPVRRSITGPSDRARSRRVWCGRLEITIWCRLPKKGIVDGPGGSLVSDSGLFL